MGIGESWREEHSVPGRAGIVRHTDARNSLCVTKAEDTMSRQCH